MESRESTSRSRRTKGNEKPQQRLIKNSAFHGYRSTEQWVEEASRQCRAGTIFKPEEQQHRDDDRTTTRASSTPSRTTPRKKDGRGVHFKQENERSVPRSESKLRKQTSPSPAVVHKVCFADNQAAALSPISLNVAPGGRQTTNSIPSAKQRRAVAGLPQESLQRQDQVAVLRLDGVQAVPSAKDDKQRQVVWCNAVFEADDDSRSCKSQDSASAPSSRLAPGSCSNGMESEITDPSRLQLLKRKDEQEALASKFCEDKVTPGVAFALEKASSSPSAGRIPGTVLTKSPEHKSTSSHVAELKLDAAPEEWYTPVSESTSQSSRGYALGNAGMMDLSKAGKTMGATPSFRDFVPTKSGTDVKSTCESAGRRNSKAVGVKRALTPSRSCITGTGTKGCNRLGSGAALPGKANSPASHLSTSTVPNQPRLQHDNTMENDLEADNEYKIEEEISKEILQLTERLAALHAKQESRRAGGCEKSVTGGMSCPPTPDAIAHSPKCNNSANESEGRVIGAKFLQHRNDGSGVKNGPDKLAERNEKFNEAPFLGRPNPPRSSLGTPARLLKNKAPSRQRSSSPSDAVKADVTANWRPEIEAQSGETTVTVEEYLRNRARMERGNGATGAVCRRTLEEVDRKDCDQRNDTEVLNMKERVRAPCFSTGSASGPSYFYPDFDRKINWVKSLRNGSVSPARPGAKSRGRTFDKLLKRESERQDIHTRPRESMDANEDRVETPNFHLDHDTSTGDGPELEQHVQESLKKMRMAEKEDANVARTPSRSKRPISRCSTPLSSVRASPATPSVPPGRTTPLRGSARIVPSRYGTPVKATPTKLTPGRFTDPKPSLDTKGEKRWSSYSSPRRRCSKDSKAGFPVRKISPTKRRGYPSPGGASGTRSCWIAQESSGKPNCNGGGAVAEGSKNTREMQSHADNAPKVERKITVIEAEYEKFVQGEVKVKQQVLDQVCSSTSANGTDGKQRVESEVPVFNNQGGMSEPPNSASNSSPKKIYIRCSDLIKTKHGLLVKEKQRLHTGQDELPSGCQGSEESVLFARMNNKTDSSQLDGNSSRGKEASFAEGTNSRPVCRKDDVGRGPSSTTSGFVKSSRSSNYDIVYDDEVEKPGKSAYLPEDYTLDMMLQFVDTLKSEREGLPRIKATKDTAAAAAGITCSPRDSGCIKRTKDGERGARCYFKGGGGGANNERTQLPPPMDNEVLSPSEIEGLDLESFWCLVGELEGPNLIKGP